jgi:NAD(P)H-flavin reductase/hemoglobin-like flavoprotein
MDPARLKGSFARVAAAGDEVPLYFYSHLFLTHPETRAMFPVSMAAQRDRLVGALLQVVGNVDHVDTVVPLLQQLGRDHRKYGVDDEHYAWVGASLLATLQHFLGEEWTPELAANWTEAYTLVAQVMTEAMHGADDDPPWYDAEIIAHERRAPSLAVLTVRPATPVPYQAGQSVSVQSPIAKRQWRYLSPANAPREDHTLEFHVSAIGSVSGSLVYSTGVGDVLRLGPPIGSGLELDPRIDTDVLMLAGGTGLAPLRALIEDLASRRARRRVFLYAGARRSDELYDLPTLQSYEQQLPWLRVMPVVSDHQPPEAFHGTPAEVAVSHRSWSEADVCVCGSDAMVAGSFDILRRAGVDPAWIHREAYGYDRYSATDTRIPSAESFAQGANV